MKPLNIFSDPGLYQDYNLVNQWLASCLKEGNLLLVLGAGASAAFELPQWGELVKRLMKKSESEITEYADLDKQCNEILRTECRGDKEKFIKMVRECLYEDVEKDINKTNPEMASAYAHIVGTGENQIDNILTFNFDSLLDDFLESDGKDVQVIDQLPEKKSKNSVKIFHIHGLIPFDSNQPPSPDIVFTKKDFTDVIGRETAWRKKAIDLMSTCTVIFIGVSGSDRAMLSMFSEIKPTHHTHEEHAFWGIRVSANEDDTERDDLQDYGIYQLTMGYDDVSKWLKDIQELAYTL